MRKTSRKRTGTVRIEGSSAPSPMLAAAARPVVERLEGRLLFFKPYTHVAAATEALLDATADGKLTIAGEEYALHPKIVEALTQYHSYYKAGVVGPDTFPDLIYGQTTIHASDVGVWMRHVYQQAWRAQTDPDYTEDERKQILAW